MQNDKAHDIIVDAANVPSSAHFEQPTAQPANSTSYSLTAHREGSRFYYPELDAIRLFLFFGVWSYHALPRDVAFYTARHVPLVIASAITTVIRAGMCSLDVFFVLSAYLITELLLREREANGTLDLKTFYVRRLLRIWPLYFFMIGLAGIFSIFDKTQALGLSSALAFLLFAGNWAIVLNGYSGSPAMIVPLWSVSFEEQFYLLWPLVLRRASRALIYTICIGLFTIGAAIRLILLLRHSGFVTLWYNSFVRVDSIVCGIVLATVLHCRPAPRFGRNRRLLLLFAGVTCWLIVAAFCGLYYVTPPLLGGMVGFPLMSLGAVALFLTVFGSSDDGIPWMKHPALLYFGKISYGLYAYHILALRASYYLFSHYHRSYRLTLTDICALAITFILAATSFKLLESPFLRLKQRRFTYIPSGPPIESVEPAQREMPEARSVQPQCAIGASLPAIES